MCTEVRKAAKVRQPEDTSRTGQALAGSPDGSSCCGHGCWQVAAWLVDLVTAQANACDELCPAVLGRRYLGRRGVRYAEGGSASGEQRSLSVASALQTPKTNAALSTWKHGNANNDGRRRGSAPGFSVGYSETTATTTMIKKESSGQRIGEKR